MMERAVLSVCLVLAVLCGGRVCGQTADAVGAASSSVVWEGVRIDRDIAYGPRGDAPGEGNGRAHRSGQFFDFLVDAGTPPRTDAPVYVNLHGGAWCQPFDKDGESLAFFKLLVARGFVVVNANYQLQNDVTASGTMPPRRPHATFHDMLRDLDDLGTFLVRDFLPRHGVKARSCALGGWSAGAHLALLYAYDQDHPGARSQQVATLPLQQPVLLPEQQTTTLSGRFPLRHDLRVGFAVDVVGPVDLADDDFIAPLLGRRAPFGTWWDAAATDRLLTLLGWLVDDDLRGRRARGDEDGMRAVLARFSPTRLVTPRTVPTILAYCRRFPFAGTDGCVPTSAYYGLRERLETAGVPVAGDIRTFRSHGRLGEGYTVWLADQIAAFARRGYLK